MNRSVTFHRLVLIALILGMFAPLFVLGGEQLPGRKAMLVAERTDAGDWYGTWYYKTRSIRVVMWIRAGQDELPEYRLQYQSLSSPESFMTDWNGLAEYSVRGNQAVYNLKPTSRDENVIKATLHWDLQFDSSGRTRSGDVEMYRGRNGRVLVMMFPDQKLTVKKKGKIASSEATLAWTFLKASKRTVRWEEIPF
jgi:hypothetical protein